MIVAAAGSEVAQQLVNALGTGATYALLALGLAMVFSILGMVNFAHGQLVTVAGYTMYFLHNRGVPFAVQVVVAPLVAAVAAIAMERLAFRPLRDASFATLLLASFALSIILENAFLIVAGAQPLAITTPAVLANSIAVGPTTVSAVQLYTAGTCLLSLIVLNVFLSRSTQGLGMRAAAGDFQATRLVGVRANRVIAVAFAISGAMAGIAAIFIVARRGTVDPAMGTDPVIAAFIATVIGGLGSLSGAVVGGFVLGALEVGFGAILPSSVAPFQEAFSLLVVIAILYIRPQGLLGRAQEAA